MTAPAPLGHKPTIALGAPFGRVDFCTPRDGRAPVILHRLGGEKERETIGPRELRDATCAALESRGYPDYWGLGGVCVELEDAGNFAIAGYSWFTFDLASHIDATADDATLDQLDARIVALEDAGCFPIGWHEQYLPCDEEALARAAVKFGPALSHAEQLQQTIRTSWSGRGEFPDIEVSIARSLRRTSALELRFLAMELRRRGVWTTVIAPAIGEDFSGFAGILANAGNVRLSAPGASHVDCADVALFSALRHIAETNAPLFRQILAVAKDAFPIARAGWNISVTEEDVHMMPDVDDAALASTFIDHPNGRETLLCTWNAVCESLGAPIRSALA